MSIKHPKKAKKKGIPVPATYAPLKRIRDTLWKLQVMSIRKAPSVGMSGIGITLADATHVLEWFEEAYINTHLSISKDEKALADRLIAFINAEIESGRIVIPADLSNVVTDDGNRPAPEHWSDIHRCVGCKNDFKPKNPIEAKYSTCSACLKPKLGKVKEFEVISGEPRTGMSDISPEVPK
jgi:hypothetical protein